MNEYKLLKSLDVNGVRVNVFSDGTVKIYGKNKSASDVIIRYMESEGILDNIFNSSDFKCKRN
jgi:phenylpyruvate tautomerase PptA (4-oxalocrotonate tautomerase family)